MTGCCSIGKSFNSKVLGALYRAYPVVDAIAPLTLDLMVCAVLRAERFLIVIRDSRHYFVNLWRE